MVRKVALTSDGWEVVWSDPLEAGAVILNPCTEDGSEDKADKVEVALYDGKVGERGGRESHVEGASLRSGRFKYVSLTSGGRPPRGETPFGEKYFPRYSPIEL